MFHIFLIAIYCAAFVRNDWTARPFALVDICWTRTRGTEQQVWKKVAADVFTNTK